MRKISTVNENSTMNSRRARDAAGTSQTRLKKVRGKNTNSAVHTTKNATNTIKINIVSKTKKIKKKVKKKDLPA